MTIRPSSPILLALLWLLLYLLSPAHAATWDPRLSPLGVTLQPAADCSAGCWRLVSAQFEDEQQSAGLHHVWARALDEQGGQLAGEPWTVAWEGGSASLQTKAPPEWADFPMFDCYFPEQGPGAYTAFAGSDPARSDQVQGMGLPACHHVSFRLVWQWTVPLDLPPRLWLPVATK